MASSASNKRASGSKTESNDVDEVQASVDEAELDSSVESDDSEESVSADTESLEEDLLEADEEQQADPDDEHESDDVEEELEASSDDVQSESADEQDASEQLDQSEKRSKSKTAGKDAQGSDKKDKSSKSKSKKKSSKKAAPKPTGLFGKISDVTSSAFKFARKTTDTSYKVGKAIIQSQDQLKLMVAAGQSLKDLREVAGLTISELNDALQLKDRTLLEAVESGTATLSFELILRLSALLARNDPIPFILKYSRTYSPETWKLLNDWGAGRLPIQYQREREFINIFRSKDQARQLSDEGYNKVLEFTREAFNMSLHFVAEQEASFAALKDSLTQQATADDDSQTDTNKPQEDPSSE